MILFGELQPGQAVTLHGIAERLGAGLTPVRESIRQLTAEGALVLRDNRRVCVPRLSCDQVDQLILTRLAVEPAMAARAVGRMGDDDIATLEDLDARLDAAIAADDVQSYLRANCRFHFTFYEAADADFLLAITRVAWLRFGPSLRMVFARLDTSNVPDQHHRAIAALRAGDREGVAAALESDIREGLGQLRAALRDAAD